MEHNGELPGPAAWYALGESREQGRATVALARTPRGLLRAPSHRLPRRLRARHSPRRKGTRRIGLPDEGARLAAEPRVPRQGAGARTSRTRREARDPAGWAESHVRPGHDVA